jgi:hypothetical protein
MRERRATSLVDSPWLQRAKHNVDIVLRSHVLFLDNRPDDTQSSA